MEPHNEGKAVRFTKTLLLNALVERSAVWRSSGSKELNKKAAQVLEPLIDRPEEQQPQLHAQAAIIFPPSHLKCIHINYTNTKIYFELPTNKQMAYKRLDTKGLLSSDSGSTLRRNERVASLALCFKHFESWFIT